MDEHSNEKEQQRQDPSLEERQEQETPPPALRHPYALGGAAFATIGAVDLLAHLGPTGLLVGAIAGIVAARHGNDLYDLAKEVVAPLASLRSAADMRQQKIAQPAQGNGRSVADRLLGRFPDMPDAAVEEAGQRRERSEDGQEEDIAFDLEGEDDLPLPDGQTNLFLFSSVLEAFHPSLDRILLARTATGQDLYCTAKDLCHVALAGNTGGGKSSIMRMLMLQLCSFGVRVLLLNPHYTRYDVENDEDWTPFEPYLVHPPMECRSYQVIEHYLKHADKELIPKRLERRAHSQPVGKPYFIVIDELPSIVREVKAAPDYIRIILEEGRKVGVLLISAAQDFLVKSISPKAGGGSIRECYRTAYYVGGDATTAHVLLDMPANLIPEDALGKGVVMLRGVPAKKATQVWVLYVENASLYRLLGPSTYTASRSVSVPEVDFPYAPTVYSEIHDKQGVYIGVNAPVEPSDRVKEDVFTPAFINEGMHAQKTERAPVNDEIRKHIHRMSELGYPHREISKIVGLYGPKYALYKRVCAEEGIKIEKEG